MQHMLKHLPLTAIALATTVLISACGGGDASPPPAVIGSSGLAVDDYISGATVVCDTNGSGASDPGEATVTTDSTGFFKFSTACAAGLALTGGTNIDTKLPFVGKLRAPAGSTMLTPLTTLLAEGMTLDQVNAAVGLPVVTDVMMLDPAAKAGGELVNADLYRKTLAVQQVIQKTAETLAALQGSGADVTSLYSQVAASMATALRADGIGSLIATNGVISVATVSAVVKAAATSVSVPGINTDTLSQVLADGFAVQAQKILTASDAKAITDATKEQQGSTVVQEFVKRNISALQGGPNETTAALKEQLADEVRGEITPPPPPPLDPNNLVLNPGFSSGTTGWSGNAANVVTEGGNSFNFASVDKAGNPSDVNLFYVLDIPKAGVQYKLRFKASSSRNRTLVAGIGLNQDPWTNVAQTVNLTTTQQTFELNLTSNFANSNSRVLFDMGADTGTVVIDDVELVLVAAAPAADCSTDAHQCISFSETNAGAHAFDGLVSADVFEDASNRVLKIVKGPTGLPWAGATIFTAQAGDADNTYRTLPTIGLGISKLVTLRVKSGAAVGAKIGLKLENSLDKSKFVITEAVTTKQNEWETLTFDFATLTAGTFDANATYNMASVFPAFSEKGGASPALTGNTEFYFDELKYAVAVATPAPEAPTNAPTTTIPEGSIVVYSEAASIPGLDAFPQWGQATKFAEVSIASNKSLKYTDLNYQGLQFNAVDVSGKSKVRFDLWTPKAGKLDIALISSEGKENAVTQSLTAGSWNSVEIDLSQYTVPDKKAIFQIKLDSQAHGADAVKTVFVDNIHFTGTPSTPAPSGGTFSSGFASNVLTKDGGAIVSSGGSNLDDWNCTGEDAWCGSGANAAGGVGADSSMYFYYQTPSAATGLYSQIEVFAPNVINFSGSGDTGGVDVAGKAKVNFNFNPNPEWYQAGGAKVAVVLTLGKRFPIDNGCRLQLHGVKPITSDGNVAYSMNLTSDFRVAADCGQGIPPTDVAAALAKSSVVSSVKFVGADGDAALIGRNEVKSTANLSVKSGNVYPTTVALKGAITFD